MALIHLGIIFLLSASYDCEELICSNTEKNASEVWTFPLQYISLCCHPHMKRRSVFWKKPFSNDVIQGNFLEIDQFNFSNVGRYECFAVNHPPFEIHLKIKDALPGFKQLEKYLLPNLESQNALPGFKQLEKYLLPNLESQKRYGLYWSPEMLTQSLEQVVLPNEPLHLSCKFVLWSDNPDTPVVKWYFESPREYFRRLNRRINHENLLHYNEDSSYFKTSIMKVSCDPYTKKHYPKPLCYNAIFILKHFTFSSEGNYTCRIEGYFREATFMVQMDDKALSSWVQNESASDLQPRQDYTKPQTYCFFKSFVRVVFSADPYLTAGEKFSLNCSVDSPQQILVHIYRLHPNITFNASECNNSVIESFLKDSQLLAEFVSKPNTNDRFSFEKPHASPEEDSGTYLCVAQSFSGLYLSVAASHVEVNYIFLSRYKSIVIAMYVAIVGFALLICLILSKIYQTPQLSSSAKGLLQNIPKCHTISSEPFHRIHKDSEATTVDTSIWSSPFDANSQQGEDTVAKVNYLPSVLSSVSPRVSILYRSGSQRTISNSSELLYSQLLARPPSPLRVFPIVKSFDSTEELPWEIDANTITLQSRLFEGEFGSTYKATVQSHSAANCGTDLMEITVVAKLLKDNYRKHEDLSALRAMLQKMKEIPQHGNIIRFLGTCSSPGSLLLVTEYAGGGTLLSLLQHLSHQYNSWLNDSNTGLNVNESEGYGTLSLADCSMNTISDLKFDNMRQLLIWLYTQAAHLADAMDFLSNNKVIHASLAAKNVLIGENHCVKLKDFGRKRLAPKYKMTRWMSPERLEKGVIVSANDVWSFGVVLWEFFTLGCIPYPEIFEDSNVARQILMGQRLSQPFLACSSLCDIIQECCQTGPSDRPSFAIIMARLTHLSRRLMNNEFLETSRGHYLETK